MKPHKQDRSARRINKAQPITARRSPLKPGLLVAFVAVLNYLPTARYDFTFDDVTVVKYNPAVQYWGNWHRIFFSDYWPIFPSALYRPITIFSFALERALHGSQPMGFHVLNILLHGGVSLLVFLIANELLQCRWAALFSALLFAVHPIHTEVVAGVVGRSELLSTLFVLFSFWIWIRSRRDNRMPDGSGYMMILVLYLLGIASKESAIVLPALIVLWELSRDHAGAFTTRLRATLSERRILGLGAGAVAFLLLRAWVLGGLRGSLAPTTGFIENPLVRESSGYRIITAIANQWRGLSLHVWPSPLIGDYSYETLPIHRGALDPAVLMMIAFVVVCLSAWFAKSRLARNLAFASSWYLVSVFPTTNIPLVIGTVFAERLFYLPSIGLCLGFGSVVAQVPGLATSEWKIPGPLSSKAALAVSTALVIGFSVLTFQQTPVWENDMALTSQIVKHAPSNVKARLRLGDALVNAGKWSEAVEEYRRALEIDPTYAQAAANLVLPLTHLRRIPEAIETGEHALVLFKGQKNSVLLHLLAMAYLEAGDSAHFLTYISRSLEIDPENARAHVALGLYYMQGGDRDLARQHFKKALSLNPRMKDGATVRNLLARLQ